MKLKLKELMESKEAMVELAKARGLKSVVAYRIGKNVKEIDRELENYNDARKKLVEEKANKNDSGEPIIKTNEDGSSYYEIDPELAKKLDDELNELLNEAVDINIIKVSLDDIENAKLSAFQINKIDFMLEVEV